MSTPPSDPWHGSHPATPHHGGQEGREQAPLAAFRTIFAIDAEQIERVLQIWADRVVLLDNTIRYFVWYRRRRGAG